MSDIINRLLMASEVMFTIAIAGVFIVSVRRNVLGNRRERKKVLNKFEEAENKLNIVANKDIFTDIGSKYRQLIIDESKEKIYYFTALKGNISNFIVKEFEYKDIAGFEVVQNRKTELLVVGDYVCNFSKSRSEEIYMQGFRVLVNDIKSPNIEIIVNQCPEGERCRNSMPCIKEWTSKINIIMQKERVRS